MPRQPAVDRERIRELLAKGLTAQQVAYRLRCSETVVKRIRQQMEGAK